MRAGVALLVLGAALGCGDRKRQRRTGDAAPVELIVAPQLDGGKSSESDEKEPNDTPDIASGLPLGGTARGRIEPITDADTYRIDVEQAGALTVLVAAVDGVDLTLEIEDSSGATLAKSDRGGAKVVEGVPNLGVGPGRYTAIVRQIPPKAKKPPRGKKAAPPPEPPPPGSAPVYHISAHVAPFGPNAEREPDDDRGTANDLIVGDPVTGFVGWSNDADVWKLSIEALSAKNVLDLELGPVESVMFTVELADGVGQTVLTRRAPKHSALVVRNLLPVVAPGAPPFHYLTVKADKSNPETPYTLKISAHDRETEDDETEPNDTVEKAMAFPEGRTVAHGTWTPGDIDCYVIAPEPGPRTLDIGLVPGDEADLQLELVVDGKPIAESKKPGKGTEEKLSGAVPPNSRAVIRVRGTDTGAETKYDLHVHEGAATAP